MSNKLVSVILPVFNAGRYLEETLNSLIIQSYENIEIIIVDDGSSDNSREIISKFSSIDERISFFSRENRGLIYTLNELLKLAKGEFIARADADDIYHIDRIKEQVKFLESNPHVAVVGTSYNIIDADGKFVTRRRQICHSDLLKIGLLFGSVLAHPSVMFNRFVCNNNLFYSSNYTHAEDYELWVRLTYELKLTVSNLDKCLMSYRIHSDSVSSKYIDEQIQSMNKALYDRSHLGLNVDEVRLIQNKNELIGLSLFYKLFMSYKKNNKTSVFLILFRLLVAQLTKARFKFKFSKGLR